MALPLPPGLTSPEIAFLCEMELVTVIPRQRMNSLQLLSGPTPPLTAGRSTPLPLYLALLLHRQRRANILPPPWLTLPSLEYILKTEIDDPDGAFSAAPPWPYSSSNSKITSHGSDIVSPPFIPHSTTTSGRSGALPYHWLEIAELLLAHCPDSFSSAGAGSSSSSSSGEANAIRGLLRDIREVRQSKLRAGMKGLEGGGVVSLRGVGAMEVGVERGFVVGVVGGLRVVGGSREAGRREREEGGASGGADGGEGEEDEMDL